MSTSKNNTKKKKHHLSKFSQELAEQICERIATSSDSLKLITAEFKLNESTIFDWIQRHPEFAKAYTRAKERQADFLAEEIISISNGEGKDEQAFVGINHVHRDRLKIDARKWAAAKLAPTKYGDKLDLTSDNKPINTQPLAHLSFAELKALNEQSDK